MRHSRSTNSGHRSSPWPAAWPRLPVAGCSWLLSSTHARDKPARGLRGDERAAVLIHLTAADLPAAETVAGDAAPHVAGEPRSAERTTGGPFGHGGSGIAEKRRSGLAPRPYARVTGGPGLPDTVVKRLTCAGRIRTAVHDQDGTVLDLGRSHRVVSERLYRALLLRDAGRCTHPGCANTRDLQAHHVRITGRAARRCTRGSTEPGANRASLAPRGLLLPLCVRSRCASRRRCLRRRVFLRAMRPPSAPRRSRVAALGAGDRLDGGLHDRTMFRIEPRVHSPLRLARPGMRDVSSGCSASLSAFPTVRRPRTRVSSCPVVPFTAASIRSSMSPCSPSCASREIARTCEYATARRPWLQQVQGSQPTPAPPERAPDSRCCYARLITVPITTVNSRFSASAEAGSGSYASTGGCYPTTSTRDSSSPTRLRSNTNTPTSPPTRLPPAGLATASTGTTPSASSPNAENNWRIRPADTIPASRCTKRAR